MNFYILYCKDNSRWNNYLKKIPEENKSPHFSPEYYKLFEKREEGRGICFVGEENKKIVLYPALVNSINKLYYDLDGDYFDIQGAYGYNGPITNSTDATFLNKFSKMLLDYCQQSNIVAEFIRFCPVIGNHEYLNYIKPNFHLNNVLIDMTCGLDNIWKNSFDRGVRKAIRKALKKNLIFDIIYGNHVREEHVRSFLTIYKRTMHRNQADEYYHFSKSFITNLFESMPDQTLLAFVSLNGKPISTELVLYNSKNSYGFLGGTLAEFYQYNPNSFLRFELIKRLIELNLKRYSIGGGKTKDDTVFRFKKSFSRNIESQFYIGKYIHNQVIYDSVVLQWSKKFPEKISQYKNFHLKYRY